MNEGGGSKDWRKTTYYERSTDYGETCLLLQYFEQCSNLPIVRPRMRMSRVRRSGLRAMSSEGYSGTSGETAQYSALQKTLQVARLRLPATFYLSLFVSRKKSTIYLFWEVIIRDSRRHCDRYDGLSLNALPQALSPSVPHPSTGTVTVEHTLSLSPHLQCPWFTRSEPIQPRLDYLLNDTYPLAPQTLGTGTTAVH